MHDSARGPDLSSIGLDQIGVMAVTAVAAEMVAMAYGAAGGVADM
ncbi:hypothetical protein ACGFWD_10765 [Streptomyces sp. NPDC048448]